MFFFWWFFLFLIGVFCDVFFGCFMEFLLNEKNTFPDYHCLGGGRYPLTFCRGIGSEGGNTTPAEFYIGCGGHSSPSFIERGHLTPQFRSSYLLGCTTHGEKTFFLGMYLFFQDNPKFSNFQIFPKFSTFILSFKVYIWSFINGERWLLKNKLLS